MATSRFRAGAIAVSVILGFLVALQSRVNGELAHVVGSGIFPAEVTMVTGLVILTAVVTVHAPSRRGVRVVASGLRSGALPWFICTGGLAGAFFLVIQSTTVPLVGVAVFTVSVVAGQTAGSLVVDRFGLTGTGQHAFNANRVVAAVFAVVAVAIGVSDRLGEGWNVGALAGLGVLAGALVAPQQAFNGRVAMAAGSAFVGALVNFIAGAAAITIVLTGGLALAGLRISHPWGAPWWAYFGGAIGCTVIAGASRVVPMVGVLVFTLASVLGQLVGALSLDLVAPTAGTSLGWHLLVGTLMTLAAVMIAVAPRRRELITR